MNLNDRTIETLLTIKDRILNIITLGLYGWLQGRKLVRPYK